MKLTHDVNPRPKPDYYFLMANYKPNKCSKALAQTSLKEPQTKVHPQITNSCCEAQRGDQLEYLLTIYTPKPNT